jgi:hypothetical protein
MTKDFLAMQKLIEQAAPIIESMRDGVVAAFTVNGEIPESHIKAEINAYNRWLKIARSLSKKAIKP